MAANLVLSTYFCTQCDAFFQATGKNVVESEDNVFQLITEHVKRAHLEDIPTTTTQSS